MHKRLPTIQKVLNMLQEELIAKTLKAELPEYSLAQIEYEFPIPEVRRIADVVAKFPNGWIVAHECQLASITVEELEKRTEDYLYAGVDVIWWLGKAADASPISIGLTKVWICPRTQLRAIVRPRSRKSRLTRMDLL